MGEVHLLFSTKHLEELGNGDWELADCYVSVVPRVGECVLLFDDPPFDVRVPAVRMETVRVRVTDVEWQFAIKPNQSADQSAVTVFVEPWDFSQALLLERWEQRVIERVKGE